MRNGFLLMSFLQQSDILSVNTALTPETKGKFNREVFARMKPSSIFINTARGSIHNEPDLIEALQKQSDLGRRVGCNRSGTHASGQSPAPNAECSGTAAYRLRHGRNPECHGGYCREEYDCGFEGGEVGVCGECGSL